MKVTFFQIEVSTFNVLSSRNLPNVPCVEHDFISDNTFKVCCYRTVSKITIPKSTFSNSLAHGFFGSLKPLGIQGQASGIAVILNNFSFTSRLFFDLEQSSGEKVVLFFIFSRRFSSRRFFFRQTTDLIVYLPLFSTDFFRFTVRVHALAKNFFEHLRKRTSLKGPLFSFFSALCDFVFDFFCHQRVSFKFFDYLQQTGFSKSSKGPPFTIVKTLRFLSLRYTADFRRCRLVY